MRRAAPCYLQRLSPHGGDEDWVAVMRNQDARELLDDLIAASNLYCGGNLSEYKLDDHRIVVIGAHA